ncbi:MAG: diacylglycerol kinase family lipid kinase [Gammaproteobacteria bacterium]|nr:diacylglycerol kinase family lipid kinase [Gammaproteobacteria bacterium]
MSEKPVSLFLNPVAGRGRAGKLVPSIREILGANGLETIAVESGGVGDLEAQVCEHCRSQAGPFIVAGGDGSVHEAVNGILRADVETPFGLIPVGTGNDFAKACGISLDWETAASLLAGRISDGAPARRVDAGKMNERYFANGAGIGFDAKINRIARKYQWPIGDLVYLVAVLEGLWDGVITPSVKMTFDDQEYSGRITLANISNGAWVGGMFFIAPTAENDDGHFDLVIAEPVSRLRVLALLPKLIKGTHTSEPDIRCHSVESFELIADAPVPSHLDGEAQPMQTEFRISILKDALSIL